ncbi:MAG: protein kinase [Thermoanaerobaculales bacterium]
MTLVPGTRLGPYEILAPLGAGGMGEVYRKKDGRLGREVAVKVLPAEFADDPERLRRFEREARAVAQLSHPNILAIYEVGAAPVSLRGAAGPEAISAATPGLPRPLRGLAVTEGEGEVVHYIVSELLEGETLREALAHGALPARKVVDLGVQIAKGLAAAHEKGIVHRDLKPENVFLTGDGHVKILDFGLAKLRGPILANSGKTLTTPPEGATGPGVVLGTVGYMSPEQVRGEAVDHRSDIFSFGVVLYEMLNGRRAFSGSTAVETMHAILKDDPPEIAVSGPGASPALQRIMQHCLEKKPAERFQSARDIAFALQALSGSAVATGPSPVFGRTGSRPWLLLGGVAAVAITLLAGYLVGRSRAPSGPSKITRLTFRRGQVDAARFAPDGQTIVYSAAWDGSPFEVYSTRLGSTESRTLGFSATVLAGMASSGEMALLRNAVPFVVFWPTSQMGMLASAPLAGGPARDLAEGVRFADWSVDGKQLAVVRFRDGKTRLEFPIGHVLYETGGFIANPRFSPRGNRIAFLDLPAPNDPHGSVAVVDLSGRRTVLADFLTMTNGLAWSPKGDEVWFAGGRSDLPKDLHAVTLSGRERVVYRALTAIHLYDIGADGRVLLAQEQRRRELWGRAAGAIEDRDLTWMDTSALDSASFDGKTVVINEFGEGGGPDHGVYLRAMDGSAPVRIGSGAVFDLSADGKWVLTIARQGTPGQQVVLLPTGAGQPRELLTESLTYVGGVFSPDGKKIIFGAMKPGEAQRIYVQDVDGGRPREAFGQGLVPVVTPMSADGRFVVLDYAGHTLLQSLTGGDPRPIPGLSSDEGVFGFTDDGRVYVGNSSGPRIRLFRVDPATGRRQFWKEIGPADATGAWPIDGVCVTPDGSAYVYNFARRLSDLYLIEGLK